MLTEWWADMGVSVDTVLVDGLLKSAPAREAPEQDAGPAAPALIRKGVRTVADWANEARALASASDTLDALASAIRAFDGSPLKAACEQAVVFDGIPGAPLMLIGEGPGEEEDRRGLPFVGKAGQLLDKMLSAIGQSRAENTFITNVNYWRPQGNRNPEADELAVCRPFVDRMIELVKPRLIIAAGGVPAVSLLASTEGIMKLRGNEYAFATPGGFKAPLIPILHPAYLLSRPQDKSRAWRDLMLIEKRLAELAAG